MKLLLQVGLPVTQSHINLAHAIFQERARHMLRNTVFDLNGSTKDKPYTTEMRQSCKLSRLAHQRASRQIKCT